MNAMDVFIKAQNLLLTPPTHLGYEAHKMEDPLTMPSAWSNLSMKCSVPSVEKKNLEVKWKGDGSY